MDGGSVPSPVGPAFVARRAKRRTRDLTGEFAERFDELSEQARWNLIAHFRSCGAGAGSPPLAMTADMRIGSCSPSSPAR